MTMRQEKNLDYQINYRYLSMDLKSNVNYDDNTKEVNKRGKPQNLDISE